MINRIPHWHLIELELTCYKSLYPAFNISMNSKCLLTYSSWHCAWYWSTGTFSWKKTPQSSLHENTLSQRNSPWNTSSQKCSILVLHPVRIFMITASKMLTDMKGFVYICATQPTKNREINKWLKYFSLFFSLCKIKAGPAVCCNFSTMHLLCLFNHFLLEGPVMI